MQPDSLTIGKDGTACHSRSLVTPPQTWNSPQRPAFIRALGY